MLRLSQGQLNLLETCPRKFQHIYIDQLGSLTSPDQQERSTWGTRFHLLMQQRELGLPVPEIKEAIDPVDGQLQRCVEALIETAPEIFQLPSSIRQSEYNHSIEYQGYLLTVVYDLLILDDREAQILDWKTYSRPHQPRWLEQNWQTRLYRFVLAETRDYAPEQISMTYWFVQGRSADTPTPQSLRFAYDSMQHQQTKRDLDQLLNQLTDWLERYQAGQPFPQIAESASDCDLCTFAMRCQRGEQMTANQQIPDLADIQEIVLS
ncbi:MAG: PD-(D/E)XK nuclease family protein [Cyanobacteria bacterium RU_5_0]|nr:PD-(D/E)XK nuclease family protein [Cyanobacteria bacterium RU_5_0]